MLTSVHVFFGRTNFKHVNIRQLRGKADGVRFVLLEVIKAPLEHRYESLMLPPKIAAQFGDELPALDANAIVERCVRVDDGRVVDSALYLEERPLNALLVGRCVLQIVRVEKERLPLAIFSVVFCEVVGKGCLPLCNPNCLDEAPDTLKDVAVGADLQNVDVRGCFGMEPRWRI